MTTPDAHGSHAVPAEKKKSLAWLWILLAVLLLGLLAWWLLTRDDEDDDVTASPDVVAEQTDEPMAEETDEPVATETPEPDETEAGGPAATTGLLLVGEVDLLAGDIDPTTLIGEQVGAEGATVQTLVADEAFLVGPDSERTVLVRLPDFAGEGEPESPMDINEGDTISFTGTVTEFDESVRADLQLVDEDALTGNVGDVYIQIDELRMSS